MNIRIGACAPFGHSDYIHSLGGSHIESGFAVYAGKTDEDFDKEKNVLLPQALRPLSMNSMLPPTFNLYDTEKEEEIFEFVRRGMARAADVGCKNVVFCSGGARNIPEGMDKEVAATRIAELAARFCEIAEPYGITISIEPLRAEETNFIHTMDDAYDIVRRVPECKNLGINPDMYHMYQGGESFDNLSKYKQYVFNVHIADPVRRTFPRPDDECEALYVDFFKALKASGYTGNVSIEAHTKDFKADAAVALPYINALVADL